ncbi:uncharacterized protein LOC143028835 [Oratosquilla oratoria]|uniref:uncharacterized protein LOC143028835 n=1 Tax=Oratosquilla oratoria TaxID=337810 RepID=UPI003F773C38
MLGDIGTANHTRKLESFAALNFFHSKVDWNAVNKEIANINWNSELENKLIKMMVEYILTKLQDICTTLIPQNIKRRQKTIPRDRRILMKKRTRLVKQLKTNTRNNHRSLKNKIKTIENKLAESHENELKTEERRAVDAIKNNPKYFYSYARSKAEIRSSVGPISWQGRQITDPKEIADALDEQYNSVYSKPLCNTTTYQPSQNREGPQLEDIEFNREDIEQAIASINTFSAAGPDMVPAILLKKCSHTLSTPLYILWRTSLDAGQVPRVLKQSLVTPIFKGGDKAAAKNYRPMGKKLAYYKKKLRGSL